MRYNVVVYGYLHIPKCGGNLIKRFLMPPIGTGLCPESINFPHEPVSWFDKHDHDHVYITTIRDPYDRAVSEYFYLKRQLAEEDVDAKKFDQNEKDKYEYINNISINEFLEQYSYLTNFNYLHYFDSKSISDFDFVGSLYENNLSVLLINSMFGLNIRNEKININPCHEVGRPYNFEYSRFKFAHKHSEDYEIYNLGIKKFAQLCKKFL